MPPFPAHPDQVVRAHRREIGFPKSVQEVFQRCEADFAPSFLSVEILAEAHHRPNLRVPPQADSTLRIFRAEATAQWQSAVAAAMTPGEYSSLCVLARVDVTKPHKQKKEQLEAGTPSPVSHLEGDREFADSPLEGTGFEPSVPLPR